MRHVVFRVGSERYCLPLSSVREVVLLAPVSRVPRAPAALKGIMNLRGRVVTVLDLATLLGVHGSKDATATVRVVLLDRGRRDLGLLVDEVDGIHGLDELITAPGQASPSVRGVARLAGHDAVTVLDADGVDRQVAALIRPH